MPTEQNLRNHHRFDPLMHFFVIPVVLLNFFFSIAIAFRHPQHLHLAIWWIILSAALAVLATKCRVNDLKLQDRIIRLEERLRLQALLDPAEIAHIDELTTPQFIALRFASDEELPALVQKTLAQNLCPKSIKESIVHWRADHHRV